MKRNGHLSKKQIGVIGAVLAIVILLSSMLSSLALITSFDGNSLHSKYRRSESSIASDPSYKYIITNVNGTYYAKNATGTIISSGTNAATVINSALNSLTPGRSIKEKVFVQASASLTSSINMPNYAILECAPGVIFTESGVTQLIGSRATHDWEIIGGEWVCTDKAVTSASTPMYFSSPLNCLIKDSKVRDSMWNNIVLENAMNVTIFGVESYHSWPLDPYNVEANGWAGIIFDVSGTNCTVDSCYLHDNGHGGCYFYSNEEGMPGQLNDNILRNNRVERVGTSGLSISQRSQAAEGNRNLIENNTLIDCGLDTQHPVINIGYVYEEIIQKPETYINPALNNVVRNNSVIDNGIVGPTGTGADEGIKDQGQYTEIYGNDIRGCTGSITLLRAEGSYVHDNYIHDAPSDTAIEGGANNSTIVDNSYHNMGNGVSVSGTGNIIQNNTLVP